MNILTTALPQWVSILFLICFLFPILSIAKTTKIGAEIAQLNQNFNLKVYKGIIIFYLTFFIYVAIMAQTGIFQVNVLPPRIFIFTTIPLFLFYILFVMRTNVFKVIFSNISLSSLVRLHIFRFVGVFFLIAWYYKALPSSFALIGGIGDIFAAITAIFVANMIDKNHKYYKNITLIWNIIGLWDILNVIVAGIYLTKISISTGSQGVLEMANFPFALIPAFAPATIVFLHILIFIKLKATK